MYNGTNILTISSGGDIKKYALRVFSHIFNTNEMAEGIIDPNQRARANGKVELDAKRVELLKSKFQVFLIILLLVPTTVVENAVQYGWICTCTILDFARPAGTTRLVLVLMNTSPARAPRDMTLAYIC